MLLFTICAQEAVLTVILILAQIDPLCVIKRAQAARTHIYIYIHIHECMTYNVLHLRYHACVCVKFNVVLFAGSCTECTADTSRHTHTHTHTNTHTHIHTHTYINDTYATTPRVLILFMQEAVLSVLLILAE